MTENFGNFFKTNFAASLIFYWSVSSLTILTILGPSHRSAFTVLGCMICTVWKSRKFTLHFSLCSRNFQNVKLRLDFVEIWSFYRHSDFTWNHILGNSNSPKMLILTILEALTFDFSIFEELSSSKFTKFQSSESLKLPKMTFLDCLNSPKCDFT